LDSIEQTYYSISINIILLVTLTVDTATQVAPSFKGKCKRRVCEAAMCLYKEKHMFKWPANTVCGEKWTIFVNIKRKSFLPDKTSRLCYQHFSDDQFTNMGMYKAKLVNM